MTRSVDGDTIALCEAAAPGRSGYKQGSWTAGKVCRVIIYLACFAVGASYGYLLGDLMHALPSPSDETPQQLHLSLGISDGEYVVTWQTMKPTDTYLIWCEQPCRKPKWVKGLMDQAVMVDYPDYDFTKPQLYRKYSYTAVMIVDMGEPNKDYIYQVSTSPPVAKPGPKAFQARLGAITSQSYVFRTNAFDDSSRSLDAIFYGDLGLINPQSVPRLKQEVNSLKPQLIIHNGDFAYDLNTNVGQYGDAFMRLIEPIAARVPYQTSVGNHEANSNFSEYNHRFNMINRGPINKGERNNFFYSFNAGPIHFVAFSTEFYYFLKDTGLASLVHQYNWLIADLKFASSRAERAKRPWIVVFGHRPMYCSSRSNDDCTQRNSLARKGLPFTNAFGLEKLFYQYGVDVELYSHEHQYERFLPIYDEQVFNGTDKPDDPYYNPRAPVHIISGSAGCQENLDPFSLKPAPGSVKQIADYGYTRLLATRQSLQFQQVSDDQAGTIVDTVTIFKDKQNFPPQSN